MKTMTCRQLGGACDTGFHASTFEEMAELSKQHGIEMFQQKDEAHFAAMNKMKESMGNPADFEKWMNDRREEFELLPDD